MKAGPRRMSQALQTQLLRTARASQATSSALTSTEWTVICADAEQRPEIHLEIFSRVSAAYSCSNGRRKLLAPCTFDCSASTCSDPSSHRIRGQIGVQLPLHIALFLPGTPIPLQKHSETVSDTTRTLSCKHQAPSSHGSIHNRCIAESP